MTQPITSWHEFTEQWFPPGDPKPLTLEQTNAMWAFCIARRLTHPGFDLKFYEALLKRRNPDWPGPEHTCNP